MKTLGEIRRNLVSFYGAIQTRITDFSIGSVTGGLFYAFSSSLEGVYRELEEIRRQAYVATATGDYLNRLIDGTFQLKRTPSTRAVGYVVVYGASPLADPQGVKLRYADFDYDTGEFLGGVQSSTKFIGFNLQGEEGIVFSLINPRDTGAIVSSERLILLDRSVQFLVLPVASVARGSKVNVREGGIYSFPSPPPGLSGVLNTSNPGAVFFASQQAVSGAPFYSRFTEILGYNNETSSLSTLNSFNFSNRGFLEVTGDLARENEIVATYTNGTINRTAGLIFEYIDSSTSNITLALPLENSLGQIPKITVLEGNEPVTLDLTGFTYKSVVYAPNDETIRLFIEDNIASGLRIQQRPDQISSDLIFDPDSVLTDDYKLIDSARVSGASDQDTDAQYRESLRKYLASLSRATNVALEAGTLRIPGVSFAKTLPSSLAPRGSAVVLASDENGTLPGGLRGTIRTFLENEWKAAGVNIIIKQPELIRLNTTLTIKTEAGVFRNAVTQQVIATVEEYYSQIDPGDSIRYSDLLEAITRIGGVTNVFNMIISKQLTDDTYVQYKGSYDEEVLNRASTSGLLEVNQPSHGLTQPALGASATLVENNGGSYSQVFTVADADGILYRVVDADNIEVFEGDAATLYNLYESLVANYTEAVTYDYFSTLILDNLSIFGSTEETRMYFLSYILGEPVEELGMGNYPLIPEFINYSVIRDYESSPVEIFRANVVNIGTSPTIVVGTNYI